MQSILQTLDKSYLFTWQKAIRVMKLLITDEEMVNLSPLQVSFLF
jgi:hypothetical protein